MGSPSEPELREQFDDSHNEVVPPAGLTSQSITHGASGSSYDTMQGQPRWWVKSNGIGEDSSACALERVKLDLRVIFSPSLGRSGSYLGSDPAGLAADFCEPNLNEPFMNGGRS